MSARTWRARGAADPAVASVAAAVVGCGAVVGLAGAATQQLSVAAVGGLAAAAALTILIAAGWLDGLWLVAVSLPLPALYASDDGVRLAAAAPLTAAVVFAWLLRTGSAGIRLDTAALPRRATAALLAAFILAAAFAPHPLTSARETVNMAVLVGFLVVATHALRGDRAGIGRLALVLAAIAAACGALAALETAGALPGRFPRPDTPFHRAALGFGQPNGLGLFLAVLTPFTVHALVTARSHVWRAAAAIGAAAAAIGLVGTFSRGSWLALLAGASALLVSGDRRFALRIWVGAALAAVALDVASGGALRDTAQRTIGDWVLEQRAALMLAGVLMFLEHPLLGVGPGGFAESLDRFGAQVFWLWDYLPTPHNAFVQMAAEAGVLGLAAYLLFLGAALHTLLRGARRAATATADPEERSLRRTLLWSFATACFAGFVIWPFSHGTGQAVLLVLAMGCALEDRPARQAGAATPARAAGAGGGAAQP